MRAGRRVTRPDIQQSRLGLRPSKSAPAGSLLTHEARLAGGLAVHLLLPSVAHIAARGNYGDVTMQTTIERAAPSPPASPPASPPEPSARYDERGNLYISFPPNLTESAVFPLMRFTITNCLPASAFEWEPGAGTLYVEWKSAGVAERTIKDPLADGRDHGAGEPAVRRGGRASMSTAYDHDREPWQRLRGKERCEVCDHQGFCRHTSTTIECMFQSEGAHHSYVNKAGQTCYLHHRGSQHAAPPRPAEVRPSTTVADPARLTALYNDMVADLGEPAPPDPRRFGPSATAVAAIEDALFPAPAVVLRWIKENGRWQDAHRGAASSTRASSPGR